jgi:hypothetical protein
MNNEIKRFFLIPIIIIIATENQCVQINLINTITTNTLSDYDGMCMRILNLSHLIAMRQQAIAHKSIVSQLEQKLEAQAKAHALKVEEMSKAIDMRERQLVQLEDYRKRQNQFNIQYSDIKQQIEEQQSLHDSTGLSSVVVFYLMVDSFYQYLKNRYC